MRIINHDSCSSLDLSIDYIGSLGNNTRSDDNIACVKTPHRAHVFTKRFSRPPRGEHRVRRPVDDTQHHLSGLGNVVKDSWNERPPVFLLQSCCSTRVHYRIEMTAMSAYPPPLISCHALS